MKATLNLLFLLLISTFSTLAQSPSKDSLNHLEEITIRGYHNSGKLLRTVNAVSLIDSTQIRQQQNNSLLSIVNSATGIRMEERSPGSYRFSIRGSLLRSPFGVRNVKIYLDDYPLTDAGGNTYLNLLDVDALAGIEIYKGPESSSFGANTGGAILLNTRSFNPQQIEFGSSAGSFGLLKEYLNVSKSKKKYAVQLYQSHQQADGYRENSELQRDLMMLNQQFKYLNGAKLKSLVLFSNLNYQTPGGLTLLQFEEQPRQARPGSGNLPGASAQKAGVYNRSILFGLSNEMRLSKHFKQVLALFGSYTDFKNPFITNYEKRYEDQIGIRSFIEYSVESKNLSNVFQLGIESAKSGATIQNFTNKSGTPTQLTARDRIDSKQTFGFLRFNFDYQKKYFLELSTSLNNFTYTYKSRFPVLTDQAARKFRLQLMPKLGLSYLINSQTAIRASASKGYSAPTIGEVRSSNRMINTDLEAEFAWNYELGIRMQSRNRRLLSNLNLFTMKLKDAIVRQLNSADEEYFINAGSTAQRGLEFETQAWISPEKIRISASYTFSDFRFINYKTASGSFDGNRLTGVPMHVLSTSIAWNLTEKFDFFFQNTYTSKIPLNDASSLFAKAYHLGEMKLNWHAIKIKSTKLSIFSGVNNLFNSKYSLGNDLNAAGGRYFNAAPKRNYYFGLKIIL